MLFPEKVSRIRCLISERDAIDDQLRELLGEDPEKPRRGRPKKAAGETPQLSLVPSEEKDGE